MCPQIVILIVYIAGFGYEIGLAQKNKSKPSDWISSLLARLIVLFLLYKGGFFNVFFHAS